VGTALLVEYYLELPIARGEDTKVTGRRLQATLEKFKQHAAQRYTEGTLQRLLGSSDVQARRAAVLALGMIGSMQSNILLAARLRDDDRKVQDLAVDALWSLWFRADSEANNKELERVRQMPDGNKKRACFDALIKKAPAFAEAYNQRAI